ncbi:signal peptidase I [Polymorphobacter sp.]|uniref:signal peptidase I n=1 Tax=Polymorphobacter sp. TaxID=1909290 RepID=UPI003F6E7FD7
MTESAAKAKGLSPRMVTDSDARTAHQQRTQRLRERLARLARLAMVAGIAALVLRGLVYEPYSIPSQSMQPALQRGDTIFVAKWPYGFGRHALPLAPSFVTGRLFAQLPDRGDLIVFKTPRDHRTDIVKRVIGLPGDRVAMHDGRLILNGRLVPRSDDAAETLPNGRRVAILDTGPDSPDFGPALVPDNHLFVLGDHRGASADSRWSVAEGGVDMVPFSHVVGRADFILFSVGEAGLDWQRLGKRL